MHTRGMLVLIAVAGCYRDTARPGRDTPVEPARVVDGGAGSGAAGPGANTNDRSRRMTAMPPPACTVDTDCTVSYAGPDCCPPPNTCGGVVSKAQLDAFAAFCAGVDCGPPVPSSSCMSIIGLRGSCTQGTCVGVR